MFAAQTAEGHLSIHLLCAFPHLPVVRVVPLDALIDHLVVLLRRKAGGGLYQFFTQQLTQRDAGSAVLLKVEISTLLKPTFLRLGGQQRICRMGTHQNTAVSRRIYVEHTGTQR